MKKKCPECENETTLPLRVIVFAPCWPFGHWHCNSCGRELGFTLFQYYLTAILGLMVVGLISTLVELLGYERGTIPNAISMFVVALVTVLWLPARLGKVRVLHA